MCSHINKHTHTALPPGPSPSQGLNCNRRLNVKIWPLTFWP